MRNRSGPLPVLMALLMMKMTLVIGKGQELRGVNLSLVMKSFTTGENIIAHLAKLWETML